VAVGGRELMMIARYFSILAGVLSYIFLIALFFGAVCGLCVRCIRAQRGDVCGRCGNYACLHPVGSYCRSLWMIPMIFDDIIVGG